MKQFIGLNVSLKDTFISVREEGRKIWRVAENLRPCSDDYVRHSAHRFEEIPSGKTDTR